MQSGQGTPQGGAMAGAGRLRPPARRGAPDPAAPFRSYAAERLDGPRFHVRKVENAQRLYPAHKHDYFQIIYYLTGAPPLRIGLCSDTPRPGSIYFIAPMVPHQIRFDLATRCIVLYFDLDFLRPDFNRNYPLGELVRLAPEFLPFAGQNHLDLALDANRQSRVEQSISVMAEQSASGRLCAREIMRAELGRMLATLCQDHETAFAALADRPALLGRDGAHMRRIAEFLADHYADGPSLAEAAAAAGLSKSRLCALIRQLTGTTFSTLIREMRIEDASERLATTDEPIGRIAFAVGYQDEKYFMRAFKRTLGMTPGTYRASRAASAAAGLGRLVPVAASPHNQAEPAG
jgi:AraC-like DNA-binding protein